MTLYISVTKDISAMKLIEIIDKKVNLQFDNSKELFQIEISFLLIRIKQKYVFI